MIAGFLILARIEYPHKRRNSCINVDSMRLPRFETTRRRGMGRRAIMHDQGGQFSVSRGDCPRMAPRSSARPPWPRWPVIPPRETLPPSRPPEASGVHGPARRAFCRVLRARRAPWRVRSPVTRAGHRAGTARGRRAPSDASGQVHDGGVSSAWRAPGHPGAEDMPGGASRRVLVTSGAISRP